MTRQTDSTLDYTLLLNITGMPSSLRLQYTNHHDII